ncbi:uncharacterized protein BJ171DRAFT_559421 [Polychytrium aggregatum]|uniref:uncharacterized protein n=1 Tax=Polychytrium aggregatum TaxID=110093 RepID=UPI0022FF2CE4|nr:uncharacterized protein BJ171DRAFT_559421 [Polychytrium aggregatum]KAI9197286.1 hypothetical protein BJ171DRAFT_559421 [Polychytrium aggregatum]
MQQQSDRQLEQIRKLEEREKNLSLQLQHFERELAARQTTIDTLKRKAAESLQSLQDFKEKHERQKTRADETLRLLKDKTVSMEKDADQRNRLAEQVEVLKKKSEMLMEKQESQTDVALRKQLEDYKLLLKCSSCNTNFKSHTLLKCMHTFCKGCIDDMCASRQRKCPTCGLTFAHQDIREVYL